jgi:hypothetical protein
LAEQICNNFDCGCLGDIKSGSIAPDKVFRDFRNHHYYNPSICTPSSYYTCPTYYDDIALEKTDYWLDRARSDSGCDMWYAISHLRLRWEINSNTGTQTGVYADVRSVYHIAIFSLGLASLNKNWASYLSTLFRQSLLLQHHLAEGENVKI